MAFDVFISYAHHDNATHNNWVRQFAKRLSDDYRSRCGKPLQIFLDNDNLNTGDVLSSRLQGALKESRLFIPILSPTYLSSRWCRREFLHFLDQPGGVIAGESSRIVPLRLMPYDRFGPDMESREEVERITSFMARHEILFADFYQDRLPIDPDAATFKGKIAALSEDVYDLLQKTAPPAPTMAPGAETIFLAYASSGAQNLREGILKELQNQYKFKKIAQQVAPAEPFETLPDKTAAALEKLCRAQMASAVCAVFLFEDLEGPKAADTREPVSHLQYRMANARASEDPHFRIFYAKHTTEDCASLQEQFLNQVALDARNLPNLEELPAFEIKAIKDFLLDYLLEARKKSEARIIQETERQPQRVFFIHDHRDKDEHVRNRIDDVIFAQQHDVYVPVFQEDMPYTDPDASFRKFWMVCDKAVVLLLNATTAWCNGIKVELIKTATEKTPPYRMAICVTDPEVEKRIREVRSHEFTVINCVQDDFELRLTQFLNTPAHA